MKSNLSMRIFVLLALGWCAPIVEAPAAEPEPEPDLVFVGTIQTIEASPLRNSLANWMVTFKVDRVEHGEFAGETFAFRIHSPSGSGLVVGKTYTVEAMRTETGYQVDTFQWIKRKANKEPERDGMDGE